MKPERAGIKVLNRLSENLLPILVLAVPVPGIVLMGFGVYALFRYGYILHFTMLLALSAFLGALGLWLAQRRKNKTILVQGEKPLVGPSPDWADFDTRVWEEVNAYMDSLLSQDSGWGSMTQHSRAVVIFTAKSYHGRSSRKELAFSAVELLRMTEEVSRRYRLTLKKHVPYIESINISFMMMVYEHKDKAQLAGKFWNMYRAYRIFTPYGLIAEARGLLMGRLFTGMSQELQCRLKKAFLQEVASVAIDLYSGRFRFEDDFAGGERIKEDQQHMVTDPDPLRLCLIGQTGSGKSAVINALLDKTSAEVNLLPSTDRMFIHEWKAEELGPVHLVDLPGLNGDQQNTRFLLHQLMESDMVLWVVKASQPSRSLDVDFWQSINSVYAEKEHRSRKRPVFIGILNQVDLLSPANEWQPPYDLDPPDSPKAEIIKQALQYNKGLLNLDQWIPLSVAKGKNHYNLGKLLSAVISRRDSALQVQLNRKRMHREKRQSLTHNLQRAGNTASAAWKNIIGNKQEPPE